MSWCAERGVYCECEERPSGQAAREGWGSSQSRYLFIHHISEMYGAGIFVAVTVLIPSITDYYST